MVLPISYRLNSKLVCVSVDLQGNWLTWVTLENGCLNGFCSLIAETALCMCACCRKLAKNYIPKIDRTDKKKEPEYVSILLYMFLSGAIEF